MLVVVNILIFVVAVVLGRLFADRFVARGYSLNSSLRPLDSLALLGILIGLAFWIGMFFFMRANPGALWGLPEWVELVHQDIFEAGFLFAVVFLCSAVAFVAWRQPRRSALFVICLSVAALCCYLGYSWHRQKPIAGTLGSKVQDGVILQTSGVSCAAAATANVLNELGENTTEREMAARLNTTSGGTLPTRIAVVARDVKFKAERVDLAKAAWREAPVPCVIFVDHPATGPESHAVSLMSITNERFEVWDPLVGRLSLSADELAEIWHGRGIAISRRGNSEQ